MADEEVLNHIQALVDEEHELMRASEAHGGLDGEQRKRLDGLQIALDQAWDLLRQRRARRETGRNPEYASERDPNTVERYQQ
jgi:hypothetical protein